MKTEIERLIADLDAARASGGIFTYGQVQGRLRAILQREPSDAMLTEIGQRVYDECGGQIVGMAKALIRAGWEAALRSPGDVGGGSDDTAS